MQNAWEKRENANMKETRPSGIHKLTLECTTAQICKEIGCKDMDWAQMTQDIVQYYSL
jgi:hypothetical protein